MSGLKVKFPSIVFICSLFFLAACAAETSDTAQNRVVSTPQSNTLEAPTPEATSPSTVAAPEADSACSSADVICIGLVTNDGRIDPSSPNYSIWEAVLTTESDFGATVDVASNETPTNFAKHIEAFAVQAFDIIVTTDPSMKRATEDAARDYPNIYFIGINQEHESGAPNLAGILFSERSAGFLAGSLAGMMSETGIVAAVHATESNRAVLDYNLGFEAGANAVNPDIQIISSFHPGGEDISFVDLEWGGQAAKNSINQGADIVFGAGKFTGNGALIQTAADNGKTYCIGVDFDEWETNPNARPCLLTSAKQNVKAALLNLIEGAILGVPSSGTFIGEVELAAYREFESIVPPEIQSVMNDIKVGLNRGEITTDGSYVYADAPRLQKTCSDPNVWCIGLMTDGGPIDDFGINDAAWLALQNAQDSLDARIQYVVPESNDQFESALEKLALQDMDIIVTAGPRANVATQNTAAKFPDIYFIGIDQFQTNPAENIAGLIYIDDQVGFLAGAVAATLTESGTISAVFGFERLPPVLLMAAGFEAGARFVRPDINVISNYHPGDLDKSFNDPVWGAETVSPAMADGADVIFATAGLTGEGALTAAGGTEIPYCIGFAFDQWETLPAARSCLFSSVIKVVTGEVEELIEAHIANEAPSGNVVGEIGLAPYHDFSGRLPAATQIRIEEIVRGLQDGTITTGVR